MTKQQQLRKIAKQKHITAKDFHLMFPYDEILTRLSSLEERVKKLENPPFQSGVAYTTEPSSWCECKNRTSYIGVDNSNMCCGDCGKPIKPIHPTEDIREKLAKWIWKRQDNFAIVFKKIDADELADKILAIVKGEV